MDFLSRKQGGCGGSCSPGTRTEDRASQSQRGQQATNGRKQRSEDGLPRSPNTALRELSQAARSSKASYTAWADTSTHSCTHTHNGRVVLGLLAEDSPSQTGGRCASGQGFSVSCLFIIKPASPQGTLMWWVLLRSVFYLPVLRFWTKAITNTLMLLLQNK